MRHHALALSALTTLAAAGCGADDAAQSDDITSRTATILELRFRASVVAPTSDGDAARRKSVVAQLFYLAGELDKTHHGHGRFGFVELGSVTTEPASEPGLELVHYDAKLPIAWPKASPAPERYRIVMPLRVDEAGLSAFNAKYAGKCGETHYGADNLWYDFQPVTTRCVLDAADVVDVEAEVAPSPLATSDKYPEQPRFWQDGAFRVVVVHGTDGASSLAANDLGVRQYQRIQELLRAAHPGGVETTGAASASIYDDWTFEAPVTAFGGGEGKLVVTLLLTAALQSIGTDFDARFDELSRAADLVTYAGHSGLSKNIKALAQKGVVAAGQYQVFFLDGCSTFAYLDATLTDRRVAANGADADPQGTRFLDVVVNAQPAPWYTGASSLSTVVSLLSSERARSYADLLDALPEDAMPVVAGEEDNPAPTQP